MFLKARPGQKFSGRITRHTGDASFAVTDPDGEALPEEEFDVNTRLKGSLTKNGDYKITVNTVNSRNSKYSLSVRLLRIGAMDEKRDLLRHFLAALAYRTQKALAGCSERLWFLQIRRGGTHSRRTRSSYDECAWLRPHFFRGRSILAGSAALATG